MTLIYNHFGPSNRVLYPTNYATASALKNTKSTKMAASNVSIEANYNHLKPYVPPASHKTVSSSFLLHCRDTQILQLELLNIPIGPDGKWLGRAERADLRYLQHQIRHLPIIKLYFLLEDRLFAFQDKLISSGLHADHQDDIKCFAENLKGTLDKLDGVVNDLFDIRKLDHGNRRMASTRRPHSRLDKADAAPLPSLLRLSMRITFDELDSRCESSERTTKLYSRWDVNSMLHTKFLEISRKG